MNGMSLIDLSFTTLKQELPDFIYEKLAGYSAKSNAYHHQPDELRDMIAKKHSIDSSLISLSAGSDQAIMLLSSLYGRKGGHIFAPTYISYTDIKRFGKLTQSYSLHEGVYEIVTSEITDAGLIFLANPNNPVGLTRREKILELVANNRDSLVVIDEAYGDFAGESVINDVATYSNMIVLRSFSKGYALAGFRIGYMVAQPAMLEELVLESTWFNVAYTSVGAAITALENEEYFAKLRKDIVESRKQLEAFLSQSGYTVMPSYINAVLLKFDNEALAASLVDFLEANDIKVNQGNGASNVGLGKSFVRISVGTAEQIAVLQNAIDNYGSSVAR